VVKLRTSDFDDIGRANDLDQAGGATAAGLRLITRPGPLGGGACGEGLPLWDDAANDLSPCVEDSVDRWFDAIRSSVGAGAEPDRWYAHLLANEPQSWYDSNGGAAVFQAHLAKLADRILQAGWQWIPLATPPPQQYVNEDAYFNAVFNVLADPHRRNAFTFIGVHDYWNTDAERDNRIAYLDRLAARAAQLGKVLLVDETNANAPFRAGGAPYDCSYVQNSPGETARSMRAGSTRHFAYVTRGKWDKIVFLLTGDSVWKDLDYLPNSAYSTARCGPSPWTTDPDGPNSGNAPDANQYTWIFDANDPTKVP
jgi:hypothetical protein